MDFSLEWVGDTYKKTLLGSRKKLIHSVGSVAQVKFVPTDNKEGYTGLFNGADHGLIRLSIAAKPKYNKPTPEGAEVNFIPGFGLKLFKDGLPSSNVVAMYAVDG